MLSAPRRAVALVLALLALAACGDRGGSREASGDRSGRRGPMGGMMERMGRGMTGGGSVGMRLPDGVAAGDLPAPGSRGARLASRFCSACHGTPSPGRLGASEWPEVLDRMFGRMEQRSRMSGMRNRMMGRGGGDRMMNVEAPSEGEQRDLRAYYRRHALAEADEGRLPDLSGRELFRQTCSQCHAVPDPEARPPRDWADILRRMRDHMARAEDIEPLGDDEADRVLQYLRQASRREAGTDTRSP